VNTLLVTSGFLQSFGGIQSVERQLHTTMLTLAENAGGRHVTCSLRDTSVRAEEVFGRNSGMVCAAGSRVKLIAQVVSQTARLRPAVIVISHVHLARMSPLLRAIRPTCRVVVMAYGIEVWKPLGFFTRAGIAFASAVWCISRYTAQQFVAYNRIAASRVYLLPLALDAPLPAESREREQEPSLLSVSRLEQNERYKGVDLALRAHALLLDEFPSLTFRVVGEGTDVPRLVRLAADLGTSHRVRFLGSIPAADLGREYERSAIFVLPSRKEGFGIVFLEAMAHRKPVVAVAAGGAPEVVVDGECGLLAPPNDLLALYENLRRLLLDAELRRRVGAKGRARVEGLFSMEQFRRRLESLLSGAAPPLELRHAGG
jgi:phosphatidyl-myo-inositol dimannoside synthase